MFVNVLCIAFNKIGMDKSDNLGHEMYLWVTLPVN